jgi:hypothetical protein
MARFLAAWSHSLPALVLLVVLGPSGTARPADDPCALQGVPRVVAVGDVHGAFDNLVAVLRMAGIVDEKRRWSGGPAHLVQVGDFLDRGKDTRPVLDLLMRLEKEARKAGGRAHVLLGNHEVMNMLGDLRYVNPEEYALFKTPDSEELRRRFYERVRERARATAKAAGQPFDEQTFRAKFFEETPAGFVERTQALSADGTYGRWLRERPVVARINGVVFLHGGLTPEVAALGCAGINAAVRREITEDIKKTQADPLSTLAAGESGPLWYRGLAQGDESLLSPAVDQVLTAMGARAIVVGHTVTGTGRLQTRFDGRVVMIDAGMGDGYGAHRAALEVGPDGALTALYPEGREALERKAAAARLTGRRGRPRGPGRGRRSWRGSRSRSSRARPRGPRPGAVRAPTRGASRAAATG